MKAMNPEDGAGRSGCTPTDPQQAHAGTRITRHHLSKHLGQWALKLATTISEWQSIDWATALVVVTVFAWLAVR